MDYMADHSASRGIFKKQPDQIDFSYTLEHEGVVLGVGGITLINLTTAWLWLDLSEFAKKYIKTCYKVISEWLEILVKDKGIVRTQCYVEEDFEEAIRLVKHLGLHYEFTMLNFVGKKSAYMFVKFYGISDDKIDKQE
jgi:hypothetical protein